MADTYQQPRKSKNSDEDMQKVLDKKFAYGMGLGAGTFVGGMGVTMLGTIKRKETEKKAQKRFDKYVDDLDKKRVRGGGGGGGFGKFSTIQRGLGTGSKKLPKKDLM